MNYKTHWNPPSGLKDYKKSSWRHRGCSLCFIFYFFFLVASQLAPVSLRLIYIRVWEHMRKIKREFILFIKLALCNCVRCRLAHAGWPEVAAVEGHFFDHRSHAWEYTAVFGTYLPPAAFASMCRHRCVLGHYCLLMWTRSLVLSWDLAHL